MNKIKMLFAAVFCAIFASQAFAVGAVDADVQTLLDNGGASWTAIKTFALGILGFLLILGLAVKGYRVAKKG